MEEAQPKMGFDRRLWFTISWAAKINREDNGIISNNAVKH